MLELVPPTTKRGRRPHKAKIKPMTVISSPLKSMLRVEVSCIQSQSLDMCPKMSKGHALCQLRPQNLQKKRG